MPSFYGALSWGFWISIYFARTIDWYPDDPISILLFCGVELAFIASIIAFMRPYREWLESHLRVQAIQEAARAAQRRSYKSLIVVLHAVGFYGTYQYARDFGARIGGLSGFWDQTMNEAWRTRMEADYTQSAGTQLGYMGWIAVGITVYEVVRGRLSRWWLVPAIAQFAGNLLWVGRMRPFTILFVSGLMAAVALQAPQIMKAVKWGIVIVFSMFVLFWAVAIWVGKLGPWTGFNLPDFQNALQSVGVYGTGGFAYFNQMVIHGVHREFLPENTLYPFFKVLSTLKLTAPPPLQIKPFLAMPLATNVSTFMDPFFRDGGFPLVFIGILIQSFGLDALGLHLLRRRNPLSYFGWTALCFTSFMTFFTFKICEVPTWLFVGIGLTAFWLNARRRRANSSFLEIRSLYRGRPQPQATFRPRMAPVKK
jgi:hypothetical protein